MPESPVPAPPRRRWVRLSIRGLMMLVLLVGGGVGWLAHSIRTKQAAIAAVRAGGGQVMIFESLPAPTDPWTVRARRAVQGWVATAIGPDLLFEPTHAALVGTITDDLLGHVGRFGHLEELTLSVAGSAPTRAGWRHLAGLKSLTTIDLVGGDDAALASLAQIRSLESLRLHQSAAGDAGFAALAGLPALAELDLDDCPTLSAPAADRLIRGLPALATLTLDGQPAASVGPILAGLAEHHPDLVDLGLRHLTLTPADRAAIGRLGRLTKLWLEEVPVGDAGLPQPAALPNLHHLTLDRTGVTTAGLAHLARLTGLRSLRLGGPEITPAGLAALERLPLAELALVGLPDLTPADLAPLGRMAALKTLDLECSTLTPAGAAAVAQALPRTWVLPPSPGPVVVPAPPPGPGPASSITP